MTTSSLPTVICGAGIAGIASAYELAVRRGWRNITLVDERAPLSLTSDKSTECYRNWWPDAAMVQLTSRSIEHLEHHAQATHNAFRLNRRGYVYATADAQRVPLFSHTAQTVAQHGAGPMRLNDYEPHAAHGYANAPAGVDLLTDPALIHHHFPYLSEKVVALLHARQAGWFSSTEFGMYLLEQARAHGVQFVSAQVTGVDLTGGRVRAVRLSNGQTLPAEFFINAAGPLLNNVASLFDLKLPIFCERHTKLALHDTLERVPREAPLLIWADPQFLGWSTEERTMLAEAADTQWLLQQMPAGAHLRPEGGSGSDIVLMLWAYDAHAVSPTFPPDFDPVFPEVVLRGLATMLPGLHAYVGRAGKPLLDGGYYVKTRENRPLIGALPVPGAYIIGALSGYGLMVACGAAELLADTMLGAALPPYAPAFALQRYDDPQYLQQVTQWDEGQL